MSYVSELAGKKCLVVGAGVTGRAVEKALKKFSKISNNKINEFDQIL